MMKALLMELAFVVCRTCTHLGFLGRMVIVMVGFFWVTPEVFQFDPFLLDPVGRQRTKQEQYNGPQYIIQLLRRRLVCVMFKHWSFVVA